MIRKKQTSPLGQIRIIGGRWRGRKLAVIDREGLRPTTDRIRETLFNWLAAEMINARCLDCFAGSGALGFEALSRGAEQVVLIEADRQVARQLTANLAVLDVKSAEVVNDNTLNWLNKSGTPFDIVFIDPPFRQGLVEQTVALLEQSGWLSSSASIYIETEVERKNLAVPANWHLYREKTAGQVSYRLYHRTIDYQTTGERQHVD